MPVHRRGLQRAVPGPRRQRAGGRLHQYATHRPSQNVPTTEPDALARVYKRIFTPAAHQLECASPGGAADLRRASTHWLRHTHTNHAPDAGSDLRDVQTNLGSRASARPVSYEKGMTTDATMPLTRSSRTRYQRSGSRGTRLCALRMKINPAPARLDASSGDDFLRNLYTALDGSHPAWRCLGGRVPDDSV
ncbi:conserved hypothetical protein [Ricinus communis]|uniref:Uncharacterized protein n=1 Tax=Ricinus communis TaxID=3988 RepID=B9TMZ7_RICCO|nr:conserved hypothetical protein [Ricinus communis]